MVEEKKKRGRPASTKCKVVWSNVWTSHGKRAEGDEVTLPAAEIADLKKLGAVKDA